MKSSLRKPRGALQKKSHLMKLSKVKLHKLSEIAAPMVKEVPVTFQVTSRTEHSPCLQLCRYRLKI